MELIYFLLLVGLVALIFFAKKFIGVKKLKPVECYRKVKSGVVSYNFQNGLYAEMKPLTIEQDARVIELFSLINISEWKNFEDIDFKKLHTLITDKKVIYKFLDIILINKKAPPGELYKYYSSLQTGELGVVWNDFFSLNPQAEQLWSILKLAVATTSLSKTSTQPPEN